jgi:hypothetical protein
MRGKIPKTELLVTFEVVARHESYTRANLFSGISHHSFPRH